MLDVVLPYLLEIVLIGDKTQLESECMACIDRIPVAGFQSHLIYGQTLISL